MKIILFEIHDAKSSRKLFAELEPALMAVRKTAEDHKVYLRIGLVTSPTIRADSKIYDETLKMLEEFGITSFFELETNRILLFDGRRMIDGNSIGRELKVVGEEINLEDLYFITNDEKSVSNFLSLGIKSIHLYSDHKFNFSASGPAELIPILDDLISSDNHEFEPLEKRGLVSKPITKKESLDNSINDLINQVKMSNLRSHIKDLTSFGNRWTFSPKSRMAATWIFEKFVSLGFESETKFQKFKYGSNVLCHKKGREESIILICGHYDTRSNNEHDAPGADDNASGIAAILELARILSNINIKKSICFAAFGGEEQGYFGSKFCAALARENNWKIDLLINLDTIGYSESGERGRVVIEWDRQNRSGKKEESDRYASVMEVSAATYTQLETLRGDIYLSDHIPFAKKKFVCIGAYEGLENSARHTNQDTIDKIDFEYLSEVTKMVLATVLEIEKE